LYRVANAIDDFDVYQSFESISKETLHVCKMLKHKKRMQFRSLFTMIGHDQVDGHVFGYYTLPNNYVYPDCLVGINMATGEETFYQCPITDKNDSTLPNIFLGGAPLPNQLNLDELEMWSHRGVIPLQPIVD